MNFIKVYLKEARFLKWYIAASLTIIILSYSVYALLEVDHVATLGSEDQLFEWLTAISFLIGSIVFAFLFLKRRNLFYFLFAALFFLGFGEEISWGQRVIGFKTPVAIQSHNVQKEFNLHNIELLNRENKEGEKKTGLSRLLEVNLLFKFFTIIVAVILPLAVFHSRRVAAFTTALKVPVPPITITLFFVVNWLIFKIILEYYLPSGEIFQYYDTDTEIFEFVSAFIILVLSFYFYNKRQIIVPGKDLKQVI